MENSKNTKAKIRIRDILISLFTAVLFSAFLPIFVYTNNIEEASFKEVFPTLLFFVAVGAVVFGIFFLCFRKNLFLTTISSVTLIMILNNFTLIYNLALKLFRTTDAAASVITVVLALTAILILIINNYSADFIKESAPKILLLVIAVLVALNIAMALPKGIQKLIIANETVNEPTALPPAIIDDDAPNVYYLLFDEYSNSEMIKKYYGYDNSEFDRFLEEKGFAVSQNTMNGSWDTNVIITNYVNYDYVVTDDAPEAAKDKFRENNNLAKLFESRGYNVIGVGDSAFLGIPSVTQTDDTSSATDGGDKLPKVILDNTAFKALYRDTKTELALSVRNALNYFNKDNPDRYTGDKAFTMFYVCSPHRPFLFDENGNLNFPDDYDNFVDKECYLNQYIYITKMTEQIIDNILEYDEDCVIILQSDHAMRKVADITEEDKMKPLNAVYYRGEDISEIEGQSGVNTVRLVLNRLFGMNLEVLEVTE